MTEQFNPSDHTVAEVNKYLATADETERDRVLKAEADDKDRATVKAPEAASSEDDDNAKVTETKAATFQEAAEAAKEPEGEAYQKGYFGSAPSRDGDNPVDLTLAGVTGQTKDA